MGLSHRVWGVQSTEAFVRGHRACAVLTIFLGAGSLVGCEGGADAFSSGRPSEMAMVHNRIIGGPPESMTALLQVPSRFPDANEAQISQWQGSVIAWWRHPEKQGLMIDLFGKLSRNERYTSRVWLRVRDKYQTEENSLTLDEIEAALNAVPLSAQMERESPGRDAPQKNMTGAIRRPADLALPASR